MTNPFEGRKLGARQVSPQFPQRRSLRRRDGGNVQKVDDKGRPIRTVEQAELDAREYDKRRGAGTPFNSWPVGKSMHPILQYARGGKIPGLFFGGLFSGTPGSTTSNQSGSSSTTVNNPQYNNLRDSVLGEARNLIDRPFTPYTGQAITPLTGDQNQAFANIRSNQGNYSPFFNQASASLDKVAGMNPTDAGMGYIEQAGGMQTGTDAASPFVNQAGRTFPQAVNEYMSPYIDNVTDRIAELGARNLNEHLLPGIHDTFSGGNAAQFGRERHSDIAGRALRDTQEAVLGQQSKALQEGYGQAANIFGADANRSVGLAGTTGQLAQGDRSATAALGTAAGNLTTQGVQTGLSTSNAQTALGQATQAAAGTDANALATSGSLQQTAGQNQATFDYNQWQAGENNLINRLQQAQSLGQGWTLPMNNSYQSQGTTTQVQPQGSPFGQIMGGVMGAASLAVPGAGGASALGNIFGSSGLGWMGKADGGQVPGYDVGGYIPTVSRMRAINAPPQMSGTAPTGMPGMPPMAPPLPQMRQPNGQMPTPFRRGGRVDCDREPNDWKVRRGPITARFADGGPTGREANYRGWGPEAVFARMLDSLPPQARKNIFDMRDWMPDRSLGSAITGMGDAYRAALEGRAGDAMENGGWSLIDAAATAVPGTRGAVSMMRPAGQWLARQMVR